MATKVTAPKISINIDQIKNSPNYQSMIDKLNSNPLQAYKELTVLEETDNQMSRTDGGVALIKELKSKLNVDPSQLETEFQPIDIPEDLKVKIDVNPEETYKNLYNAYTYDAGNPEQKLQLRKGMSAVRKYLIDKGINPEDYLTKSNAFLKGIEGIANVLSVPSNILAKIFAKNPDKVKIWGGTGWEESLRQYGMSSDIQYLVEKRTKNIPLTKEENTKLKDFDTKYGIVGFIANVVGDPFIIAGIGGKLITGASKGLGVLGKIGRGLKTLSEPIKTYKEAKRIADIATSPELKDMVFRSLSNAKSLIKGFNKSDKQIDNIDKILKGNNILSGIDELKNTSDYLSSIGKNVEAGNILKSWDSIINTIKESSKIKKSKVFQKVRSVDDKFTNMMINFKEKSGIRGLFESNFPLYKNVKTIDKNGKEITTMIPTGYKQASDRAKQAKQGIMEEINIKRDATKTAINDKLMTALNKSEVAKTILNENIKLNPKYSMSKLIPDLIEKGNKSKIYNKLEPEVQKVVKDIRNTFDEMILTEAKYSGSVIKPLFVGMKNADELIKDWSKTADKYKSLFANNKYNPDIMTTEQHLRDLLSKASGFNAINKDMVDEMAGNTAYLTHAMTKEAKKIYQTFSGKSRGYFGEGLKSYISNVSKRQRNFKGTIDEINNSINSGEYSKKINQLADELESKALDKAESMYDKIDVSSYNKAESYRALAKEMEQFKGKNIDFFETDIPTLINLRGSRMAKTVQQALFSDEVKNFGVKNINEGGAGWRQPRIQGKPMGWSQHYFDPSVATAIENLYNYTKDNKSMNVLTNFLSDFGNFWKSTTLSTYVVTAMRNVVGNVINMALVMDKPTEIVRSLKDAFASSVLHKTGKNYPIITKSGKYINADELVKEFRARGGNVTTFFAEDTGRTELQESIAKSLTGKAIEATGNMLDKASQFIRKFPVAKLSDYLEKMSKFTLFTYEVRQGKSFDDAMKTVYKVLFDYSDLTDVEKGIKKAVPFFTWSRKNIPLQISQLTSNPTKLAFKLEKSVNENRPSDNIVDERQQSEFMKNKVKIKLPELSAGVNKILGIPEGKKNYLLLDGLIPTFDLSRVVRDLSDNQLQNTVDDLVADITPLIKTPIEWVTNRSFAFKTELQKSPYETVQFLGFNVSPKLKAVLDDWRLLATLNKGLNLNPKTIATDPKSIVQMVTSYFLGNTLPYNPMYSRLMANRNAGTTITDELSNYKTWINKIKDLLYIGKKLSKDDINLIRERGKNILMMINEAKQNGVIDSKQSGSYAKSFLNNFLGFKEFQEGLNALQTNKK